MSARSSGEPQSSRRDLLRWGGAGLVASVLPFAYCDADTRWLELKEQELRLPNWDADGFRAAIVSDVHVNSEEELSLALEAADLAVKQKADVILLPGDFVNHSDSRRVGHVSRFLAAFHGATCPVLATLGNHDYWAKQPQKIVRAFEGETVRLLQNEMVEVDGVSVVGFDDALVKRFRPDAITPGTASKSLLAMLHEPDFVDEVPGSVSLQVSGHSHGGQICLPLGIPVHTPGGAKRYIYGYYPEAHVPLFVTRGVGTTGPRYRAFCRPEVAVLTLRGL